MSDHEIFQSSTTEGLPVSPSMGPALQAAHIPPHRIAIDRHILVVCALAAGIAVIASLAALVLTHLIALFTNLFFFGRLSIADASPAGNHLGLFVIAIPVIGGLIVGFMAKYGSKAIRGHGIPEAMEQVLVNQSRIPARMTWLKPLSAAVSIGTGGPFGAEGPIIATGGAFGSLVGQILWTSAAERKTLLAAGAAAGMAATFGSPLSAVLLAIELLLFEFRARSFIPVALATAIAASIRVMVEGGEPMFDLPDLAATAAPALLGYILIGAVVGVASVAVTRIIYAIEDLFARLPIHWMWWPAIGAVAVGVIGYFAPRTLGVGYDNITDILSGNLAFQAVALLCAMKFISWSIALGSGTSGGTLAPLLTVGGGLGVLLGALTQWAAPWAGVDPRIAGLVGMAALFGGASRAMLASVVFAVETTLQPLVILPLLAGCGSSFLVSCLMMRQTIMTEKITRRGVRVPADYTADVLDQIPVLAVATSEVVTLRAHDSVETVRDWIAAGGSGTSHQGFPVVHDSGLLMGVLTRRDLLAAPAAEHGRALRVQDLLRRPPVLVYADCSLREAVDHMVRHGVGRLPVVDRDDPRRIVGIITRSDILSAYQRTLDEARPAKPSFAWPRSSRTRPDKRGRSPDKPT